MEQEQFELLSENPPEMSGDFAPITVTHNYESIQPEDTGESAELSYVGDESEMDEFDAISEGHEEIAEEYSDGQLAEELEPVESVEQVEEDW